jgi:hypothetical protein
VWGLISGAELTIRSGTRQRGSTHDPKRDSTAGPHPRSEAGLNNGTQQRGRTHDPKWAGHEAQDVLAEHLQRLGVSRAQIEDAAAAELLARRRRQRQDLPEDLVNKNTSQSETCAVQRVTETNEIHLVLFGMQNRAFSSYLAAIHTILSSVTNITAPDLEDTGKAGGMKRSMQCGS